MTKPLDVWADHARLQAENIALRRKQAILYGLPFYLGCAIFAIFATSPAWLFVLAMWLR